MKKILLFSFPVLIFACSAQKEYTSSLESRLNRMKNDSILFEKRIRSLDDEKNYLAQKCATIEQAYNNRLQEKQDSLSAKERLLRERELHLKDMKARKEEEQESFRKLSESVFKQFEGVEGMMTRTNCTGISVILSDYLLFQAGTLKASNTQRDLAERIIRTLESNDDLRLIVLAHVDSAGLSRDKSEDDLSTGSLRSNAFVRSIVKDNPGYTHRILSATGGAHIPLTKQDIPLGKNRTELIFHSSLLPCIHNE